MRYYTHYEVLQVPENAAPETIRAAYRNLSKKHHPDAGGNRALFERVVTAHNILSDPTQRHAYDNYLYRRAQDEAHQAELAEAAARYEQQSRPQVFVEEELFDEPIENPLLHFGGYLLVLVAIVAVIIGPAWIALRTVDNDDAAAETEQVSAALPEPTESHNGLDVEQSSLRWLVAYQALAGTEPLVTSDDARSVYETSRPGARCDDFSRQTYWSLLAPESQDIATIENALNYDLARAVAECNNFTAILEGLRGTLAVETSTLAERLRQVEALADQAVFTSGGV